MADDGGLARIQQRLAFIPKAAKEAGQAAAIKQAEAMAASMRAIVPVESGDLKDSITVTPGGDSTPPYSQPGGRMTVPELGAAVTAGNKDVRYSHLVEYGTVKSHAEPFFWPAVRSHQKKAKTAIRRDIAKAIKKNWGSK